MGKHNKEKKERTEKFKIFLNENGYKNDGTFFLKKTVEGIALYKLVTIFPH
jgi:hypothetical protein